MDRKEGLPALVFIGIGVTVLVALYRVPFGRLSSPDMAFFPVVLSVLLIILSCVLIGRSIKAKVAAQARLLGPRWTRLLPLSAALIAYTLLYDTLGYLLCTIALLLLTGKLAKCSWKTSLLISLVCTFISYVVFGWYMHIPLPEGILPL